MAPTMNKSHPQVVDERKDLSYVAVEVEHWLRRVLLAQKEADAAAAAAAAATTATATASFSSLSRRTHRQHLGYVWLKKKVILAAPNEVKLSHLFWCLAQPYGGLQLPLPVRVHDAGEKS